MNYLDTAFGILSRPLCGILAIAVALGTVILALIISLMAREPGYRRLVWAAIGGCVLSAGLAAPYVLAASRSESARGPYAVQQAILVFPALASDGFPGSISMQIWFPVNQSLRQGPTLDTCAQLQSQPLSNAGNPRRLVLYMPHFGSLRTDNTARLSYLASYGYIVVAFDDIAQDATPPGATREDEEARLRMWHVQTQEDFDETLRLDDIRVRRQAEKALSGLDRLTACAAGHVGSPWSSTVDYTHVGFLGYSFGGSTAAEAAVMDRRIVAVVNLDGNLFGQALAGRLGVPYLYVMSDRPLPTISSMMSKDPNERYGSRMDARDRTEQARLAARPGSAGIVIRGSVHSSLSDAVLEPHASRLWILKNPITFFNATNLYTRHFFDIHLRGQNGTLTDPFPPKNSVVQTFEEAGVTPDQHFASPPS
jgi:dienelactone hydrolase